MLLIRTALWISWGERSHGYYRPASKNFRSMYDYSKAHYKGVRLCVFE